MKKTNNQNPTYRLWAIFKKLSRVQKLRIISKLEDETREERWDQLTEKLSRRFRTNPVSDEEVTQIVEEVREKRYGQGKSRS